MDIADFCSKIKPFAQFTAILWTEAYILTTLLLAFKYRTTTKYNVFKELNIVTSIEYLHFIST